MITELSIGHKIRNRRATSPAIMKIRLYIKVKYDTIRIDIKYVFVDGRTSQQQRTT